MAIAGPVKANECAQGLPTATKIPHHHLKAAAFAQAIKEMSQLCANLGGQTDTPYGLAGIGDLEVTGLSGRNKIYGTRLGQGQSAPPSLQRNARPRTNRRRRKRSSARG